VGLGANLDDPVAQVSKAIKELAALPDSQLRGVSALYRSPPLALPEPNSDPQPDYINAVACLQTTLAAHALLDALQAIEQAHGRRRDGTRWGPRTLDLDILLYGNQRINDERLQVPHVGMAARSFVLYPLRELVSGEFALPGLGKLAALLDQCPRDGLEKVS